MGTETDFFGIDGISTHSREDGSPSWGRKRNQIQPCKLGFLVEKMGPLRGDGNIFIISSLLITVEKMGPLRGDGNLVIFYSAKNSIK